MIKRTIAIAAGLLFSLNASAGYVQYNLNGGLSGFIIENDVDKSIVDYHLSVSAGPGISDVFVPSGPLGSLYGQSSSFWEQLGPTNFSVYDRRGEVTVNSAAVYFEGMYSDTPFAYSAWFNKVPDPGYPSWGTPVKTVSTWLHGTAVQVALSPELAASYEQYGYEIPHVIPSQNVPEPGSLATLAIGAFAAFGASRRRKS